MKRIFLSHFLGGNTPFYGGNGIFQIESLRSIASGDSCNSCKWTFPNHAGTHVDMPQHFIAEGKVLEDYPPDFWIFNNVSIVELNNIQTGSVIAPESFERCCLSSSTDLLLIKTGFGSLRNKPAYCLENPIFLPELADFLRSKMPSLRAIGFDAISLSSWTDRLTGRTAHRAFLKGEKPILLIEDMRLSQINGSTPITRVTVAPLLVEGADASPCTIIAEVKN